MLESLFTAVIGDSLTLVGMLEGLGTALTLGLLISLVYLKTHKEEGYAAGYTITLIMLPAIISIIIMLVGNNVARAFSLAGAFSLIRFRSAPGDPKDIAYVFFTLAVGLACGMGYIAYAVVFVIIMCLVMVVLNYINFAKPKTTSMQLKITVPEDLNLLADEGHIKTVLANLLDNALKYSKENCKIRISASREKNHIIIRFKDNGIGIDVDQQKKVFEKFYRVQGGNLHDVKGFGLGLSYVKSLVEAHGGRLEVQSELGKGSEFYCIF